jgi:hypothetical protein
MPFLIHTHTHVKLNSRHISALYSLKHKVSFHNNLNIYFLPPKNTRPSHSKDHTLNAVRGITTTLEPTNDISTVFDQKAEVLYTRAGGTRNKHRDL